MVNTNAKASNTEGGIKGIKCLTSVAGSDSSDAKSGGTFFSGRPEIRRTMELADKVMFDSPEKRLQMPLSMDPSDEEEEEEVMEVVLKDFCHCVMFLLSFIPRIPLGLLC